MVLTYMHNLSAFQYGIRGAYGNIIKWHKYDMYVIRKNASVTTGGNQRAWLQHTGEIPQQDGLIKMMRELDFHLYRSYKKYRDCLNRIPIYRLNDHVLSLLKRDSRVSGLIYTINITIGAVTDNYGSSLSLYGYIRPKIYQSMHDRCKYNIVDIMPRTTNIYDEYQHVRDDNGYGLNIYPGMNRMGMLDFCVSKYDSVIYASQMYDGYKYNAQYLVLIGRGELFRDYYILGAMTDWDWDWDWDSSICEEEEFVSSNQIVRWELFHM